MSPIALCCLVINEIGFAPTIAQAEFVELLNTGSDSIEIAELSLYDARSAPRPVPDGDLLLPGHYLVLVRSAEAFEEAFPGRAAVTVASWPALNNAGDRVGVAVRGVEVDAVEYEAGWGHPPASLERVDPQGPSGHAINWRASLAPAGGTPGARNSVYEPDRVGPSLLFADRQAADSVFVRFSEPVLPLPPDRFQGTGTARGLRWLDDRTVVARIAGPRVSVVGVADLFGNVTPHDEIAVLDRPGPGDLIVSERMVRPRADPYDTLPDQAYFLEAWNGSGKDLSIRDLALRTPPDEYGGTRLAPLEAGPVALPAGDAAVWSDHPEYLPALGLPPGALSFELSATALREPRLEVVLGSRVVDTAWYSADWHDPSSSGVGRSLERGPGPAHQGHVEWPSPGFRPTSWASSRGYGATPGLHAVSEPIPSPAPGDLVVSEILFDAAGDQLEFVELLALAPVDLNGVALLVDRPASPPDSTRFAWRQTLLNPGERAVGVITPRDADLGRLVEVAMQAFPDAPQDTRWFPLAALTSLRDSGSRLTLTTSLGAELETVAFGPHLHHPAVVDPDGVSIERRDPHGPAGEPSNWGSSGAPAGATPGGPSGSLPGGLDRPPALEGSGDFAVHPRVFEAGLEAAAATLRSRIPALGTVRVYDLAGRQIRVLTALMNPEAIVYWDGRDDAGYRVPTGAYILVGQADARILGRTVVAVAGR